MKEHYGSTDHLLNRNKGLFLRSTLVFHAFIYKSKKKQIGNMYELKVAHLTFFCLRFLPVTPFLNNKHPSKIRCKVSETASHLNFILNS